MEVLGDIFYFLIALIILIVIHELGHFLMARMCGVYVERFSFGFGPILCSFKDKVGTEYSISLIPLGGYVKMYGEDASALEKGSDESNNETLENTTNEAKNQRDPSEAFSKKKVWQRFLIVAAGPLSNIVLAFILYVVVFICGIDSLKPAVKVDLDSVAYKAGLRTGDLVVSIDESLIDDWEDGIYQLVSKIGNQNVVLEVKEDLGKGATKKVVLPLANWDLEPTQVEVFKALGFNPLKGDITNKLDFVDETGAAYAVGLRAQDEIISFGEKSCAYNPKLINLVKGGTTQVELQVYTQNGLRSEISNLAILKNELGQEYVNLPLKDNEYLKSFNGEMCLNWVNISAQIRKNPNNAISLVVLRDNQILPFNLTPKAKQDRDGLTFGYAGIAPHFDYYKELWFNKKSSFGEALVKGAQKTISMSAVTFKLIGKFLTGDISYKNVSGPIGIAKGAGMTARIDIVVYISFIALISVNLGIFNLLPIPVLDGAHLIFYIIEAIRGKPLSEALQANLIRIGLFLLLLLMVLAVYNDISYRW